MKTIHKVLVLAILAIISFTFSSASSVMASGDPTLAVTQQAVNPSALLGMDTNMCSNEVQWKQGDQYLPLNRWGDVSSFHTRLGTGALGTGNLAERIQKQGVATMFLSAGNIMWKGATGLTVLADRFCIGEETFKTVDKMSGKIGDAMFQSDKTTPSVVALAVIIGLVGALWAASRGQDSKKKIISTLIGVGVLAVMVFGARASTADKFGFGSPGYIASGINSVVSTVAAAPASSLNASVPAINDAGTTTSAQNCSNYIAELEKKYDWWYTTGGKLQTNSIVPRSLNSMWKTTGLKVFTDAQFGTRNEFGAKVNCRYLDIASNIPVDEQVDLTKAVASTGGGNAGFWTNEKQPFKVVGDKYVERVDAAIVAWAACTVDKDGNANVEPEWAANGDSWKSANDREAIDQGACVKFFTDTNWKYYEGSSPFNLDEDHKDLSDTANPAARDFMQNWEGTANTAAIGIVMLYSVVSLIIIVVFGILALMVVGAKIGLLVVTLMMILVAIIGVFPSANSSNRVATVFKQYVGMAVLAFGASLIISMVAAVTALIQNLGAGLTGGYAIIAIIWSGISPAVALALIHYIFTKVLKAPSPFKPSSITGFAQAAAGGAVGGAVGGGLIGRLESEMADRFKRTVGIGGASRRRAGAPDEGRKGGFDVNAMPGSGGKGGPGGSGGSGGAGSGGGGGKGGKNTGGLDDNLTAFRGKLVEGADDSAFTGEDLYAARNDPSASETAKAKEEHAHANMAADWAASQRNAARVESIKSNGAKVAAGAAAGLAVAKATAGAIGRGTTSVRDGAKSAAAGVGSRWKKAKSDATEDFMGGKIPPTNGQTVKQFAKTAGSDVKAEAQKAAGKMSAGARDVKARFGAASGAFVAQAKSKAAEVKERGVRGNLKVAGRAIKTGVVAGAKGTWQAGKAVKTGARATGQFVSRHKTAVTAAALGAATVATAGIAAPVAAAYLAKKGVGSAKRSMGGERRAEDMRNFNAMIAQKAKQDITSRNAVAKEQAEAAKQAEKDRKTAERNAREAAKTQDKENESHGQPSLLGSEELPGGSKFNLAKVQGESGKPSLSDVRGDDNPNQDGFNFEE